MSSNRKRDQGSEWTVVPLEEEKEELIQFTKFITSFLVSVRQVIVCHFVSNPTGVQCDNICLFCYFFSQASRYCNWHLLHLFIIKN
jgi:hypothetical protein